MRIFVCPLDWGLGHAARCIPIIKHLLEKEIEVVIGAEGVHAVFFKEYFPSIKFIEFPGYRITYSKYIPVGLKVLLQMPKMIAAIKKEHRLLNRIIQEEKIDAVISDNRYGLWNKKIPCVIISHQLNIQAPFGKWILHKINSNYIRHFDTCWIPDYAGEENLSGNLSHPIPKGIDGIYTGPLSRFNSSAIKDKRVRYDLLAILSGPEPQRSKLEDIILKQLKALPNTKALIIQGLPGGIPRLNPFIPNEAGERQVEIVPHLADAEFQDNVNCSEVILSRPGYSTLMDLNALGWKKMILISTPGQTEQEYLGKHMQAKGFGINFNQNKFSLKDALSSIKELTSMQLTNEPKNFKQVVDTWLRKII